MRYDGLGVNLGALVHKCLCQLEQCLTLKLVRESQVV